MLRIEPDYDCWKTTMPDADLCECPRCGGEGEIIEGDNDIRYECDVCHGSGEVSAAEFDAYTAGEDE